MAKCGYEWWAPYLPPPPAERESRRQVCDLPKDHEGDHKSISNVTAPNFEKES